MSACAHVATPEAGPRNVKPWRAAKESGQTHCPYCRSKFTPEWPPTFDHKVPRSLGGTAEDGLILACQSCNSARGDAPYEDYMAAVTEEWRLAKKDGRGYRRPKSFELPDGTKIVVTLSKKERRAFRIQTRASFRNHDQPDPVL